jgi:hypothetical protein
MNWDEFALTGVVVLGTSNLAGRVSCQGRHQWHRMSEAHNIAAEW